MREHVRRTLSFITKQPDRHARLLQAINVFVVLAKRCLMHARVSRFMVQLLSTVVGVLSLVSGDVSSLMAFELFNRLTHSRWTRCTTTSDVIYITPHTSKFILPLNMSNDYIISIYNVIPNRFSPFILFTFISISKPVTVIYIHKSL